MVVSGEPRASQGDVGRDAHAAQMRVRLVGDGWAAVDLASQLESELRTRGTVTGSDDASVELTVYRYQDAEAVADEILVALDRNGAAGSTVHWADAEGEHEMVAEG